MAKKFRSRNQSILAQLSPFGPQFENPLVPLLGLLYSKGEGVRIGIVAVLVCVSTALPSLAAETAFRLPPPPLLQRHNAP